ncbi:hypothetical protein GALL_152900 [mine drainage metagenome]|uniref:Uncharacterized protein n=1 Tax=mine drainage metagenome TaxID=410659 RepID=A0A1J5SEV7_9ZZZZ
MNSLSIADQVESAARYRARLVADTPIAPPARKPAKFEERLIAILTAQDGLDWATIERKLGGKNLSNAARVMKQLVEGGTVRRAREGFRETSGWKYRYYLKGK